MQLLGMSQCLQLAMFGSHFVSNLQPDNAQPQAVEPSPVKPSQAKLSSPAATAPLQLGTGRSQEAAAVATS